MPIAEQSSSLAVEVAEPHLLTFVYYLMAFTSTVHKDSGYQQYTVPFRMVAPYRLCRKDGTLACDSMAVPETFLPKNTTMLPVQARAQLRGYGWTSTPHAPYNHEYASYSLISFIFLEPRLVECRIAHVPSPRADRADCFARCAGNAIVCAC